MRLSSALLSFDLALHRRLAGLLDKALNPTVVLVSVEDAVAADAMFGGVHAMGHGFTAPNAALGWRPEHNQAPDTMANALTDLARDTLT